MSKKRLQPGVPSEDKPAFCPVIFMSNFHSKEKLADKRLLVEANIHHIKTLPEVVKDVMNAFNANVAFLRDKTGFRERLQNIHRNLAVAN